MSWRRAMKRILVGLDGSERAPAVLSTAIGVAQAQRARVVLLRSVGLPPDLPQDFWKTTDKPLLDVLKEDTRRYLGECAAEVPAEVFGGVEIVVGVPWQAVCDVASRLDVDLIVVGSHGYSGFDHLLGTTAAKVVNHAPCSVLVVRESHRKAAQ
jgi:nucleotide-binding universal stress UspA family protein